MGKPAPEHTYIHTYRHLNHCMSHVNIMWKWAGTILSDSINKHFLPYFVRPLRPQFRNLIVTLCVPSFPKVFLAHKSSETCILYSLKLSFLHSTHISIRKVCNFSRIYIFYFNPIPRLYIQIEHKLICSCNFKHFQLEERKLILSCNFLSTLLSACMLTVLWLPGCTSRAEPCFLPLPSLCSNKLLVKQVISYLNFRNLIKAL
jgi:hypothetical protein